MIKGIKKNVFVLGLVSLFNDISSEMLYPIIPIFLTATLNAPIAVVGIIEGVAESTASMMKVVSGWLSDRSGKRKPFITSGYSLSAVSKPLLALASAWHFVLVARFIDRFGKGLRNSARDALIADSTDVEFRGKAFGFHRALDTLGAVLGPVFALILLFYIGENYRLMFLLAFVPAFIGVLLLLLYVSEKMGEKKEVLSFKFSEFSREFRLFLLVSVIFAIGNSSNAFLILRAKDIFEKSSLPAIVTAGFGTMASIAVVVLGYVVYNITYSLASMPAGTLSDRIGRRNVLAYGFFIFSLVYLGFAVLNEGNMVWILFAVFGFYIAMTDGVGKAFIVDLVPLEKRATAIGMYYTATGLLALVSSVIAGLLWDYIGAYAPFLFGSAVALVAAVLLVVLLPEHGAKEF